MAAYFKVGMAEESRHATACVCVKERAIKKKKKSGGNKLIEVRVMKGEKIMNKNCRLSSHK